MTADAVAVGAIKGKGKDWQREKPGRATGCVSGRQPQHISGDPHRNYQSRLNQRQTDVPLLSAMVLNPSSRSKVTSGLLSFKIRDAVVAWGKSNSSTSSLRACLNFFFKTPSISCIVAYLK